jgi:uncharacterized protein (TIGR00369 family)
MPKPTPEEAAAFVNRIRGGWDVAMGLTFLRASGDEVVAELEVGEQHLQPYGIVHGGVHTGIIEGACSTGAALHALDAGQSVVGIDHTTSFLHAARGGRLRVTARPLQRGRRTQVWEATVTDEKARPLATGRVRLLCLDAGAELAGGKLEV